MSERKAKAWATPPVLPDSSERSLQCADPRCGIRWTVHNTDVEASFERHWRDVGSKHAGQPLPPVGQRYTVIDPKAKTPATPAPPPLPKIEGWTCTPDPLNPERVIFRHVDCGTEVNLLPSSLAGFAAQHMATRHPA